MHIPEKQGICIARNTSITCTFFKFSDFVGPYCDIECTDEQGHFVDDEDGDIINAQIVPKFRCVQQIDSEHYKAWFGYENPNPNNVYIRNKGENSIYKGTEVVPDLTQPTKFIPGNVKYSVVVG